LLLLCLSYEKSPPTKFKKVSQAVPPQHAQFQFRYRVNPISSLQSRNLISLVLVALYKEALTVVADKGYYKVEEVVACVTNCITPIML
jgi:hypothetical protein